MLKCGECGANLIIGTGGGTHIHKKYACANYFNRGTYGNDLYIRRDILEERLLGRLQRELLRPEVIDYTVAEFGRQPTGRAFKHVERSRRPPPAKRATRRRDRALC